MCAAQGMESSASNKMQYAMRGESNAERSFILALHLAHPFAECNTDPRADGCPKRGPEESDDERVYWLGNQMALHIIGPARHAIVMKAGGKEEVLRGFRHQEIRKRPFDRHQRRNKYRRTGERNLPWLPIACCCPKQIKGDCWNYNKNRKLRRNELRDLLKHRSELGLRGEQRQDQYDRNQKHRIDHARPGRCPAVA